MANSVSRNKGINSFSIRVVAIITMLGSMYLTIKGNDISQCLLWFSFTLFAFLLIEGFNKTSNLKLYFRRLIVFTLISEIPYDLFYWQSAFDLNHQSIMFTLLIGLIGCSICKFIKEKLSNSIIDIISVLVITTLGTIACGFIGSDFAQYGILIIMVFYVSYNLTYPKLFELAVMVYYGIMVQTETVFTVSLWNLQYSIPVVAFALFATIFSWTYNEERGPNSITLKITFYLIYPISLLILYFLTKTLL